MPSQFDLTRFYVVIICNSVFQLDFLTREFQIPSIIVEEKKVSLKKKCFIFIAEILSHCFNLYDIEYGND